MSTSVERLRSLLNVARVRLEMHMTAPDNHRGAEWEYRRAELEERVNDLQHQIAEREAGTRLPYREDG